jgi:SAM-dependent methyltransferase
MHESYAQGYAVLEGGHWWFRARRLILRDLLAHLEWPPQPKILEIGVGSGCNLREIYPSDACLEGIEPDPGLATFAAAQGTTPVFNASIDYLPSEIQDGSYDAVAMFDVLEHIPDDTHALEIVSRKLKRGGRITLSVPAYMWLWGQQDIVNQHFRRYTRGQLMQKLQAVHFSIERMTYFNTFLFLPIAVVRLIACYHRQPHKPEGDFAYVRKQSNAVLLTIFGAERFFLRHLNFPFGVSVFAAARKN